MFTLQKWLSTSASPRSIIISSGWTFSPSPSQECSIYIQSSKPMKLHILYAECLTNMSTRHLCLPNNDFTGLIYMYEHRGQPLYNCLTTARWKNVKIVISRRHWKEAKWEQTKSEAPGAYRGITDSHTQSICDNPRIFVVLCMLFFLQNVWKLIVCLLVCLHPGCNSLLIKCTDLIIRSVFRMIHE